LPVRSGLESRRITEHLSLRCSTLFTPITGVSSAGGARAPLAVICVFPLSKFLATARRRPFGVALVGAQLFLRRAPKPQVVSARPVAEKNGIGVERLERRALETPLYCDRSAA